MEHYQDVGQAVRGFSYFQQRYGRISAHFSELFENFNPDALQIKTVAIEPTEDRTSFKITAIGREFYASLSPIAYGAELLGHVDFYEVVDNERLGVRSFYVSHTGFFGQEKSEQTLPVSDFSSDQTLFILNLIHHGLSHPKFR